PPGVKLTIAVLLVVATQGVGKTTLCHILAEVVGWKNTTLLQLSALLKSEFRSFAEKQLVIISAIQEAHAGREGYDKTQEYISDKFAKVRRLGGSVSHRRSAMVHRRGHRPSSRSRVLGRVSRLAEQSGRLSQGKAVGQGSRPKTRRTQAERPRAIHSGQGGH